jgi:hypothetical protein
MISPWFLPSMAAWGELDEASEAFRLPMVAAGQAAIAVHALLHHHPLAVVGDEEAVQIEVETVLHRGAVDLGHQAARFGRGRAPSKPTCGTDPRQLGRASAATVLASTHRRHASRARPRAA